MTYRVGSVEIDPANFALTRDGEAVAVEPLVFDLIVCLVQNRERVLTRQELLDTLWQGRIVSDTTLSNHIKSARQALGDDGQRQEIIRTVHGRGYRFVADVEDVPAATAERPFAVAGSGERDRRLAGSSRRSAVIVAAALLVIIAAVGSTLLFRADDTIESIAVLPLQDLSDDPAQQYFVEGMQDALITRLSRVTDLRVISKTSTVRYAAANKSIPQIARELNVDALIEGSVLRDGNRVRISAQLIHGARDEQLWSRSYDRNLEDFLPLINDISLAIAEEIEITVREREPEPDDWTRRPVDLRVHELVLQGQHYFDRFMLEKSRSCYLQAVELDPEFAPAHAGLAGSYFLRGFFGQAPVADVIPKAREAALKAIDLDSRSAGGYATIGAIQLYFDWDWESARDNLLRALELAPNDARTRHAYADYLMVTGDLEESLNQVEIGRLYDPLSPMANTVVDFHRILMRQYDAVIERGRATIAANPDAIADLPFYREALWLEGLHEEAYAADKASWGKDQELLRALERGFAESGYTGAVLDLAETLAGRGDASPDYVILAKLYARAGEPESALEWLQKAYEHRQPQILHVKAMPAFDALHRYPEFQELMRRIGFPDA